MLFILNESSLGTSTHCSQHSRNHQEGHILHFMEWPGCSIYGHKCIEMHSMHFKVSFYCLSMDGPSVSWTFPIFVWEWRVLPWTWHLWPRTWWVLTWMQWVLPWTWWVSPCNSNIKSIKPSHAFCIPCCSSWHLALFNESINTWHYSLTSMSHTLIISMH